MSKAVIFFAPGLEECEGLLCVDLLRRSGVEVTIAAVGGEKIVKSAAASALWRMLWPKSWIIPLLMPPSCPAAFRVWTT